MGLSHSIGGAGGRSPAGDPSDRRREGWWRSRGGVEVNCRCVPNGANLPVAGGTIMGSCIILECTLQGRTGASHMHIPHAGIFEKETIIWEETMILCRNPN